LVLTQRVSTASTQPRTGQTPSKATLAKLSTATYTYGKTLRQRGAEDQKNQKWNVLPVPHNSEVGELLKKNSRVAAAVQRLYNPILEELPKCGARGQVSCPQRYIDYRARQQKVIDNAYYDLVIAPQIKAEKEQKEREKEQKEREEEEERLAIATLKMRVIELEKRPTPTPTAPEITTSPTSYLPLAVVGIVIVVILLFLRRRA